MFWRCSRFAPVRDECVQGVCNTQHKCIYSNQSENCTAVGAYCIRPELRRLCNWCGGLRRGSCGGVKGVCHTPLQFPQNHNRPSFPKHPENYIGHGKNYVLCRKNYIRHNPNYIIPFFDICKCLEKQKVTHYCQIRRNVLCLRLLPKKCSFLFLWDGQGIFCGKCLYLHICVKQLIWLGK